LAAESLTDLFGKEWGEAETLSINTLKSYYFENSGDGTFRSHELPDKLQFSSLESGFVFDFENDDLPEIIIGGNFYDNNVEMGRLDGDYGSILQVLPNATFGIYEIGDLNILGQVRNIELIDIQGRPAFLLAKNNDYLQIIKVDE